MESIPQNPPVQLTLFNQSATSTVTCLVCGKQVQRIGNLHLNMHSMTTKDYKAMFPGASFISEDMREKHRQATIGNKYLGSTTYKTEKPRKPYRNNHAPRTGITKNCETCEKPFYVKPYKIEKAKFCSEKCRTIAFVPKCGPNNPQWKGGRDKNYYGPNWHSQRRIARDRDNHACQQCGKTERDNGRKLDVHHIRDFREFGLNRYEEANQISNLISLCRNCHSQITGNTPFESNP
jgi:endogenous inhibitor of DNA gyrase (YacG/DUF329 family)